MGAMPGNREERLSKRLRGRKQSRENVRNSHGKQKVKRQAKGKENRV